MDNVGRELLWDFIRYSLFFVFVFIFFWHGCEDKDFFIDFKNNTYYYGIIDKKYKDTQRNYFLFIDWHDIKVPYQQYIGEEVGWERFINGLDDFYDFLEVGDTIIKEKGSPKITIRRKGLIKEFVAEPPIDE